MVEKEREKEQLKEQGHSLTLWRKKGELSMVLGGRREGREKRDTVGLLLLLLLLVRVRRRELDHTRAGTEASHTHPSILFGSLLGRESGVAVAVVVGALLLLLQLSSCETASAGRKEERKEGGGKNQKK